MHFISINVRCWRHSGYSALEDLILGMDKGAVRDDSNQLSSEEFDECLAIVFCQPEDNCFALRSDSWPLQGQRCKGLGP